MSYGLYRSLGDASDSSSLQPSGGVPGKRALTDRLRRAPSDVAPAAPIQRQATAVDTSLDDPFALHLASASPAAGGEALPGPVRAKMERSFDADFSAVRVHQDERAASLGAVAYAQGDHLHFQPGRYDPSSDAGHALIGHELAHVVQQRAGRVTTQAKGASINADPALEREADELGAKAARGEFVGTAPSPAGTTGGGPAPIQRYREERRDDRTWRVSDGDGVMVAAPGAPGGRSKEAYATPALIDDANDKLADAGSFIRLEQGLPRFGKAQVLPRYVGPGFDQGTVYETPSPTHGSHLLMPSDCNNSARLIMGVDHPPTRTEAPPPNPEIPISETGPGQTVGEQTRTFGKKPFGGGDANLVESAGLTQLTNSMVRYRGEVGARPIATSDGPGVARFLELTATLTMLTDRGNAWVVLHTLKHQHPEVYRDFSGWAGLNEQARPEVGDALVTYLPDLTGVDKVRTNPRAYDAMVEVLRKALGGDERHDGEGQPEQQEQRRRERVARARDPVIKGLRDTVVATAVEELEQIQESVEKDRRRLEELAEELTLAELALTKAQEREDKGDGSEEVMARNKVKQVTINIGLAKQRIQSADLRSHGPRQVLGVANSLIERLEDPGADPTALAREALAMIGIRPETNWTEMQGAIMQDFKGEALGQDVNNQLAQTVGATSLWNKHWGGVVITEGTDYLTLENDASTEPHGKMNDQWGFALYGSEQPGQSFHDQMMATGDFGGFASTARFTGPQNKDGKGPRPRALEKDLPLSSHELIDTALSRAGDDEERLRRMLEVIGPSGRATLKQRYGARAPLPEPIRRLVLLLIAGMETQVLPTMRTGGCRSEARDHDDDSPPPPGEVF
jgi:hypothetical protein